MYQFCKNIKKKVVKNKKNCFFCEILCPYFLLSAEAGLPAKITNYIFGSRARLELKPFTIDLQ